MPILCTTSSTRYYEAYYENFHLKRSKNCSQTHALIAPTVSRSYLRMKFLIDLEYILCIRHENER